MGCYKDKPTVTKHFVRVSRGAIKTDWPSRSICVNFSSKSGHKKGSMREYQHGTFYFFKWERNQPPSEKMDFKGNDVIWVSKSSSLSVRDHASCHALSCGETMTVEQVLNGI